MGVCVEGGVTTPGSVALGSPADGTRWLRWRGGGCSGDDGRVCWQAVPTPPFPLPRGNFNGCQESWLFPPSRVMSVSLDMHFS